MIDFHSHLVPDFDDGAADLNQTRQALTLMRQLGMRTVVTTPHLSASIADDRAALEHFFEAFQARWRTVKNLVDSEFPDLEVLNGFEVALDTPTPDLSDPRIRLADTHFVLVEFPYMAVPPNSSRVLREFERQGLRPIVAHPERYRGVSLQIVEEWRESGALLQINWGSLVGSYGSGAEKIAWTLLEKGWGSYLSSDYHARGRLNIPAARSRIEERNAGDLIRLLTEENPGRLLRNEEPLQLPMLPTSASVESDGLWRRISRAMGLSA